MARRPRILAVAGSTRSESFNKRLVRIAAGAARSAGADVTTIDLRDYPLPLYDADLEASSGKPESAARLKRLMIEQDGLLISSPEYNSSITAVLKNTIDWLSRPDDGDAGPLVAFRGKVATLMSASPGTLGGLRGLVHLRAILGNIGVIVLPDQVAVPKAQEAFDPEGMLLDGKMHQRIEHLGVGLTEMLGKLMNPS
jgi:NAD(P)H-dependent FMN reductase